MRKLFALALAVITVFALTGCRQNGPEASGTVPKIYVDVESRMLTNEETGLRIHAQEVIPRELAYGDKAPMVIYVHGATGDANSLILLARKMAEYGIAGFTFECCGGTSAGKSDGSSHDALFPSHYTSRISDLEAVLSYVKTLSYVDTDKIYVLGLSYGGIVTCVDAALHSADYAGMILLSTGLQDSFFSDTDRKNILEQYIFDEPYEHIASYTGDVICFCGTMDETGAYEASQFTVDLYNGRASGSAMLYPIEGGGHGYETFSKEGQLFVREVMRDFILQDGA